MRKTLPEESLSEAKQLEAELFEVF